MSAGGEQPGPPSGALRTGPAERGAEVDLLGRLASGERGDALRELAERYAARLYDLGLSVLGSPEAAERLAAETIDAVASRAGEFDPTSESSGAFVLRIARERVAGIAADEGEPSVEAPGVDDLDAAIADVEFRAAVAGLGEESRGVIEAVLGEGLTRAEAGERLGLTVGIVEVRLRTALRAVRDELDARGVAADGRR